jgi:acetyl esterase
VFVEYDRSPEARYPTAIEQAYAATPYVVDNGAGLRVDPLRLAVAGDGVGGNMAAAVTLMAKQRHAPKIAYQLLFYPVTDACFDTPSYIRFADGPRLTRSARQWFWDAYLRPRLAETTHSDAAQCVARPVRGPARSARHSRRERYVP